MTDSKKWICVVGAVFFSLTLFPATLFAGTAVTFADADLRAFMQLVKPEETSLLLDGRTGKFRPAPSLEFAGLEPQDFDIDLNLGADLVDLRFNSLRAKAPTVTLESGRVRVDIALEDQTKAIKSALGSISLKGVTLSAWAHFSGDGSSRLDYDTGAISGEMKGSGLLKPKWVMDALRKIALRVLKNQVGRQLARATVQDSIEKGLVTWSRFTVDSRFAHVVPGTTRIATDGVHFEAE